VKEREDGHAVGATPHGPVSRLHPERQQPVGQAVDGAVQLAVADRRVAVDDGDAVGQVAGVAGKDVGGHGRSLAFSPSHETRSEPHHDGAVAKFAG
jgi:hypothetical protein